MSSTVTAARQPSRKPSILRHKFSLRPSALRAYLDPSEKDGKRSSSDAKRQSFEEGSWIARKRRKNKSARDEPKHVIDELKIDVGGFDDLKGSFDAGGEMYSIKSPQTVASTATQDTSKTLKPPPQDMVQRLSERESAVASAPQAMELEDTSGTVGKSMEPIAVHQDVPEPKPEVRKGPKYQIKVDTLVRPVSSGRANPLSANVSSTIAAINKNSFQSNGKWSSHVDNMSSARPSVDSSRSKLTTMTNATEKVDSVLGSNASITTTYGNARRPLADTSRATNVVTTRHSVGDMDKLLSTQTTTSDQENKRQSFPPEAARRQSLVNMRAAALRPKSPTGSIASTTSALPRPRRPSASFAASRLSWIQDLEANGGKKTPGQEYMLRKLEGGVAEKLRRFESQNSETSGSTSRSQSVTRGTDGYGIENKRLSRTVTADDDFRKKLEEQFQKKQQEDEEREKKKRASLNVNKTPQQIIDYVELNDKDREAHINDLMKTNNGADVAKGLDAQAKLAMSATARSMLQQPPSIFQNASAALKSTTSLRGAPSKLGGATQSAQIAGQERQATNSLQRTMSVQQTRKQTAVTRPARPASYAAVSSSMDDDEYDPFNYAVYPSRSSMYSNPPEAPSMTPGEEFAEEDIVPIVEAEETPAVESELPKAVDEPTKSVEPSEPVAAEEATAPVVAEITPEVAVAPEEIKQVEETSAPAPVETTKEAPKPSPVAASGWASRFQASSVPKKVESTPKTVTEEPKKVDTEPSIQTKVEPAPEAKEETKAPAMQSKLPIRGGPQKAVAVLESAAAAQQDSKADEPKPAATEAPKTSLPVRKVSRPVTPPAKQQNPASLLLSNGSVKIASPCSSPKSPEFSAASLPRFGTA